MADNTQRTKELSDQEKHILIVDDDQTLLKFFKIHLNKYYSKIIVVKNAKEAVLALKDDSRSIDLVISDIRMPRTSGVQLLKKVKNIDATIPVMLVSGALLTEEQENEIHEKADGFLKKPFTIDELHDLIEFGMQRREKLLNLNKIIDDTKKLKAILTGKASLKRNVSEANFDEANDIFDSLQKAS